jgi:hypothetical protein
MKRSIKTKHDKNVKIYTWYLSFVVGMFFNCIYVYGIDFGEERKWNIDDMPCLKIDSRQTEISCKLS